MGATRATITVCFYVLRGVSYRANVFHGLLRLVSRFAPDSPSRYKEVVVELVEGTSAF